MTVLHPLPVRRPRGVTLVIVLLLLLVVTLLGLAAMRGTLLQERMSGNTAARSAAFQVAEAVLREAESLAATRPAVPANGCSNGICAMPVDGAEPVWRGASFWAGSGARVSNLDGEDFTARYVVEDMGLGRAAGGGCTTAIDLSTETCTEGAAGAQNYRVVAFTRMPNGAEVVLQSTYQVP